MKLKSLIATLMLTLNAHTAFSIILNRSIANNNPVDNAAQLCPLLIRNTSASPIWISHDSALNEKLTSDDLEQSKAQVINPYEIGLITIGSTFTIYIRSPQSNTNYQRGFTIVQRLCDPSNDEQVIDFSLFETGKANPARFIVINHAKEKEVPEGAYALCPGGSLPELDEETDQWFCKVYRYSDVYEKYVDEYVPVLSYVYQWLPSNIWTQWYLKNPRFYTWYHHYPEFYSHLEHYQAPWQTKEYAAWYNQQPEKVRSGMRAPEQLEATPPAGGIKMSSPLGLPESKIKKKSPSHNSHEADIPKDQIIEPPITIYSKERKKQALEDIVSSITIPQSSKTEVAVKKQEKKEIVAVARKLKPYENTKKAFKKPVAMSKPGVITTQSGKQRITL